jgi:hypothetical protein
MLSTFWRLQPQYMLRALMMLMVEYDGSFLKNAVAMV